MTALRNAAFAVAMVLSGAASAMPVANLSSFAPQAVEERFVSGQPVQFAAEQASVNYFDYDAVITLGVLALAGAAFAGFGAFAARRARETQAAEPAWRQNVMRAVQADLAAFSQSYRRAA